ncbi:MAG: patatin-like phospholipase family protein [Bacteroidales bacterium]
MKKSVSLVLSSGGARGIAHIGVIEELERQGFEIKSIAGCSMGALVGGAYASGHLDLLKDFMCKLDKKAVLSLVDFTFSSNGIVKGNKLIKEISKILPDVNIEDLLISYTAVATDIINKKEIIFENGSLINAIRASISIPTVFTPFKLNNSLLVDGGVLNPLPINRVKRSEKDLLIAVDVNSMIVPKNQMNKNSIVGNEAQSELHHFPFLMKKSLQSLTKDTEKQLNYYTLIYQTAVMMMQQISKMSIELYKPDIVIKIPINSFGAFEFYNSDEIIEKGKIACYNALEV